MTIVRIKDEIANEDGNHYRNLTFPLSSRSILTFSLQKKKATKYYLPTYNWSGQYLHSCQMYCYTQLSNSIKICS
jgi:hypothetical protein